MRLLLTPETAIYGVWALWAVSWLIASVWASRAAARPGFLAEAAYRIPTAVGIVLVFFSSPGGLIAARPHARFHVLHLPLDPRLIEPLWRVTPAIGWSMVGLAAVGFLFTWWARIHLGALWSGSITVKTDHRIVDTGPYGIVRHPIYTGLLTAVLAVTVLRGSWAAMAGFVLVCFGCWLKARIEEGFLRKELGPDAYDAYRKRVPMLVPFAPF